MATGIKGSPEKTANGIDPLAERCRRAHPYRRVPTWAKSAKALCLALFAETSRREAVYCKSAKSPVVGTLRQSNAVASCSSDSRKPLRRPPSPASA